MSQGLRASFLDACLFFSKDWPGSFSIKQRGEMKIKVGTQLEEETYRNLKIAAARERRAIGEVIQNAIENYLQEHQEPLSKNSGLARFLEPDPLQLSDEQVRKSLGTDFFDQ